MSVKDNEGRKFIAQKASNDKKIAKGQELERRKMAERNEANRQEARRQFLDTRARLLESHLDHKEANNNGN